MCLEKYYNVIKNNLYISLWYLQKLYLCIQKYNNTNQKQKARSVSLCCKQVCLSSLVELNT